MAKFLCCLPVRLGVLVISFIQFLLAGGAAGIAWWALYNADKNSSSQFTSKMRASIILIGVFYSVIAIIGLTGFFGALTRKLGAIKTYLYVLYGTLVIQLAIAVFTIVSYYRFDRLSGEDCKFTDSKIGTIDICEAYDRLPQGVLIASVFIPIVVQAYACYLVAGYKNRLLKQRMDRSDIAMGSTFNPKYTSVAPSDEIYHPPGYTYTDRANAFGAEGHAHNVSNHV